jgi:magnesium transporter
MTAVLDPPKLRIAGEHATDRVPVAGPDEMVDEVRAALAGRSFECADDVAVLAEGSLVGLLSLERLLAADAGVRVGDVMDADPPVVRPGANPEAVAWEMVRRGESSVAVLDATGRFVGLVPPHRMVRALLIEHDEDIARLAGYLASTQQARQAAEEPVSRRLWHRLPWLIVGLVGALASAAIIGVFERALSDQVLLAFFIPGVVYMAAAVGIQTQAVLIRGFAVGVATGQVLRRELASGVVLSLVVSVMFLPIALLGWGDPDVAFGVSLALCASSLVSTLVAIVIPLGFQRLGRDPAFGSGPLATVLQDLLTIAIYFAIAVPVAT